MTTAKSSNRRLYHAALQRAQDRLANLWKDAAIRGSHLTYDVQEILHAAPKIEAEHILLVCEWLRESEFKGIGGEALAKQMLASVEHVAESTDEDALANLLRCHILEAKGVLAALDGDFEDAVRLHERAFVEAQGEDDFASGVHLRILAERNLRRGRLKAAMDIFAGMEHDGRSNQIERLEGRLRRAHVARLSGKRSEAISIIESAKQHHHSTSVFPQIVWENACIDVCGGGGIEAIGALFMQSRLDWTAEQLIEAHLWTYASGQRRWLNRIPNLGLIGRKFAREIADVPALRRLFEAVRCLARFYDRSEQLETRSKALMDQYYKKASLGQLEHELLFSAAALQAVADLDHPMLMNVVRNDYERASWSLSSGTRRDILGVCTNIFERSELSQGDGETRRNSTFNRLKRLTQSAGAIAWTKAGSRFGMLFAERDERRRLRHIEDLKVAKLLIENLFTVRGVTTKLAQMLSFCDPKLPDFLRAGLSFAQDSLDPMPFGTVRKVFENDFGKRPSEIFSKWTRQPVAAASISQVHIAELNDERLAVKVRYPGIDATIRDDLRNSGLIRAAHGLVFSSDVMDKAYREFNEGILRECDFVAEAISLADFARAFADSERITIPKLRPELCSENVMTMEFLEGMTFYEFVGVGSETDRNLIGGAIMEFYLRSFLQHGLLYCDPQPGNFLVSEDLRLMVCDFGNVRRLDSQQVVVVRQWLHALLEGDFEGYKLAAIELDYVKSVKKFPFEEEYRRLRDNSLSPFLQDRRVKMNAIVLQRATDFNFSGAHGYKDSALGSHSIIGGRTYTQLLHCIGLLETTANWRKIVKTILAEGVGESKQSTA